jgi:small-conductance mechanosensitive channel
LATTTAQARAPISRPPGFSFRPLAHAIIEEPEVWGVQSLGPGGITIRLVAKTKPLEQWRISRLLRERIKAEFDEEGIEVPPAGPWTAFPPLTGKAGSSRTPAR